MGVDSANEALANACVEAVRQASRDRGLQVEVLEVTPEQRLRVVVDGAAQRWDLVIECLSSSLTRLPRVRLKPTGRLHLMWGTLALFALATTKVCHWTPTDKLIS